MFHHETTALGPRAARRVRPAGRRTRPAQDKIRYYDRAKKMEVTADRATIQEETPSQITFKVGARTEKVPSADVLEVTYKIPPALGPDYRKPGNKEDKARQAAAEGKEDDRKKLTEETIKEYEELLPKLNEVKSASATPSSRWSSSSSGRRRTTRPGEDGYRGGAEVPQRQRRRLADH